MGLLQSTWEEENLDVRGHIPIMSYSDLIPENFPHCQGSSKEKILSLRMCNPKARRLATHIPFLLYPYFSHLTLASLMLRGPLQRKA